MFLDLSSFLPSLLHRKKIDRNPDFCKIVSYHFLKTSPHARITRTFIAEKMDKIKVYSEFNGDHTLSEYFFENGF